MKKKRKNVKTHLLSHSKAKVKLLGEYAKKYLSVICNDGFTEEIQIYDLFCGEGVYENGGEGSPLVILNAINDVAEESRKNDRSLPTIKCLFNDKSKKKISKLRAILELEKYDTTNCDINLRTIDYEKAIEKLIPHVNSLKNKKAFIFIDPYGYSGIKASQIKDLMASKKAEVLLWLPTAQMYRFEENGTPEALYDFLDDMDIEPYKQRKSIWKFIDRLKQGFNSTVGEDFFVDTFSIKKDEKTVFCLYFFTSHIRGFEKMMESKWSIDEEFGRGWEFTGNNPSLFVEHKTNKFEEQLRNYIKSGRRYNSDIFTFSLQNSHLPSHATEILADWQSNGMVDVLLKDGTPARKNSFYVKYRRKDHPDYQKVYFKIK